MSHQLFKKGTNGKHDNIMPKSWIEAIKDKYTGQSLLEILQGFNMYFLSYTGDTASTRCKVPMILRKQGLWITYVKYDKKVYTEWYAAEEIDDTSWGNSSNWRIGNNMLVGDITISSEGNWIVDGKDTGVKAVGNDGKDGITTKLKIESGYLYASYDNELSWTQVGKIEGPSGGESYAADEEDITLTQSADGTEKVYQFKNRDTSKGMGYVILRSNKTLAEQIIEENTIYEIRYDFNLNGGTLEIPEGCVLDFNGGSIAGGKVVFNNTYVHGLVKINTEIEGTIANENLDIRWFGAVGDGVFDNSDIIQKVIDFTEGYNDRVYVYIPDGVWGIGKTLKFRNYCGNIKGNNPFTSVIKALNQMDWMFTSKDGAEYSNPIITNVCLDGGMEGDFYKDGVFNENVTIKAKGGISFPRYWYTYFNTVRLRNIAGIAFHVNEIWNVNLENIYIQNCHIGMRLGMTNGVCISNCEFNTLSRYGIFTAVNYTIDIRNNIFEIIGKSAIFGYAPAVGQILINSNYFELCSIDGVEMFNYDGTLSYGQIHTNVIITGRNSGTTSPVKNGGTGYPCIVIKGNSLQEPNSYEKCCAFYVCNCSTLDIESNIISHEGWDLFGFILNTAVRITNVSVKNNSILKLTSDGFGQTPIQWCSLNCYHRDGYGLIMDVLTDSNKPHRDENMMKYLMFYAFGRAAFRATGSKYNGYTIYTCDEFITFLTRRRIDNVDVTDGTLDDALTLYTYYTSTDGVTWTKNIKLFGSLDQNIELKAGTYFTVPVVQYLDRNKIDNNEYDVNIPNYDLFKTINIEYKTGTVVNFTKDSNHSKCIWIGKNKFRLFNSNGVEAFNLSVYKLDGASVGCQIFDTNTKKPVWWDGSKWIDAAGEEV